MLLHFSCENCGKHFQVDESAQGKRGRCKHCGHLMKIPHPEPSFRLSPEEPFARAHQGELDEDIYYDWSIMEPFARAHQGEAHDPEGPHHTEFELIVDKGELAAAIQAPPEALRHVREIEEFQKDRRGYTVVGDRGGLFSLFGGPKGDRDRPASWIYVKWRSAIGGILKVLRFIDNWAYLISVPFLVLVLFAIVTSSRGLVHAGAVVVVLVNYGRFWADLIAFFVRPFKDGPLQGLAFFFPPYAAYYLFAHWDRMKPILRRMLTSCLPIALVIVAYAFLPSVNPELADAHDVATRLKIGTEALEKDIQGGLGQIEEELSGKGETKDEKKEAKEAAPPDKP